MTALADATKPVRISAHARQRISEMPDVDEAAVLAAATDPEWTRADAHEPTKTWHTRGDVRVLLADGPVARTVVTVIWATAEDYERGDGISPRPVDLRDVPGVRHVVPVPTIPMSRARRGDPDVLTRRHVGYWAFQFATLLRHAATLACDAVRDPDLTAVDLLEAVSLARERLDALEYEAVVVAHNAGMDDNDIADALGKRTRDLPDPFEPDPRWRAKKLARRLANGLGADRG